MKRWGLALGIVLLACLPILLSRSTAPSLLADTDTRVLITRMEARASPLSWFSGDWPLENHFYRPVTTLVFEIDQRLHPWSPQGYGLTNALLAIGCVVGVFWFLRELTGSPMLSTASAGLFALWIAQPGILDLAFPAFMAIAAVGLVASFLPGRSPMRALGAVLVTLFAGLEVQGLVPIRGGSLDWIPGRTATTMTLFALIAMASYARYERLGARRDSKPPPTALDQPATKGTEAVSGHSSRAWPWAIASVLVAALALGSYEQAVMLPACLLVVAVALRISGYHVRWGWHVVFWSLVGGYWLIRRAVLPPGPSDYQLQQFRTSIDVLYTILDYIAPAYRDADAIVRQLDLGFMALLFAQLLPLFRVLANLAAYGLAWSHRGLLARERIWIPMLAGWILSTITFLPMAWMKQFPTYNHYHFWPMALRSIFAIAMSMFALKLVMRAVSPRAILAPTRLAPAPGSLPRP